MNNFLWLLFGGRRKIEAESKRLTEEHKRLAEANRYREIERKSLEAELRRVASEDYNCSIVEALIKQGVNVMPKTQKRGEPRLL